MYIQRWLAGPAKQAAREFPAVLVTGPRQAGKTTFLQNEFPDAAYVTFDDPAVRQLATVDPVAFLNQFGSRTVILDEVQYVPTLFSYLKMRIDQDRRRSGAWLMTGSQQFGMMRDIADSLAGRIAILEILPFHTGEIFDMAWSIEDCLWRGGYPEIVLNPSIRDRWLPSYVQTYLERDVRQVLSIQDLTLFQTFLGLTAARHAQELNLAALSRQCGVSQPTARRWLSVLTASIILFPLPPYARNLGKRLVKSPKVYFLDPALAAYLTRQPDPASLFAGAMGGAFFEGFIVAETHKILVSRGFSENLSFWRSHDGLEIDLIIEQDGVVYPVEIKKTSTPTALHAGGLRRFTELHGGSIQMGTPRVVCTAVQKQLLPGGVEAMPWQEFLTWAGKR